MRLISVVADDQDRRRDGYATGLFIGETMSPQLLNAAKRTWRSTQTTRLSPADSLPRPDDVFVHSLNGGTGSAGWCQTQPKGYQPDLPSRYGCEADRAAAFPAHDPLIRRPTRASCPSNGHEELAARPRGARCP